MSNMSPTSRCLLIQTLLLSTSAWTATAVADVKTFYAKATPRGEMRLVGVAVDRPDDVTFDAAALIPARITHFRSRDASNLIVPAGLALESVGIVAGCSATAA